MTTPDLFSAVVDPARANKDPVTPEQLNAYNQVFLDEVKKGDLLFHGDEATQKQMGVKLTTSAMACAMCHPFASDTHPMSFPKFQVSMNQFATLRDMINWCIEKPNQGEKIDGRDAAAKHTPATQPHRRPPQPCTECLSWQTCSFQLYLGSGAHLVILPNWCFRA